VGRGYVSPLQDMNGNYWELHEMCENALGCLSVATTCVRERPRQSSGDALYSLFACGPFRVQPDDSHFLRPLKQLICSGSEVVAISEFPMPKSSELGAPVLSKRSFTISMVRCERQSCHRKQYRLFKQFYVSDACVNRSPAPPPATSSTYRGVHLTSSQLSRSTH
jgi:hypothetical protein